MRAVTRPLSAYVDTPVDLNDIAGGDGVLFVRNAVGVAGRGVATTVPVDEASAFLAAVDHDSTVPGAGPVALGCVPFLPGSPADLIVPTIQFRKDASGGTSVTVVGDVADPADIGHLVLEALDERPPAPATAASWSIDPGVDVDAYLAAVTTARDAVRAGELTKAVIARPIIVRSSERIDVHAVLRRLRASFGSSYRYSIDGLIGASPELLVEIDGPVVRSHPLAGTAPRTGDVDNDARLAADLIASTKNQVEHRVVIDVVHDTLLPWASYLDWEPEPSIVTVANVQHLGTRMEGMLSQPGPSVIELVRALSPTPALGGHPRDEAIELIRRVERFERGRYGGAVGWVDAAGNGTWAVAIRCAELADDRCSARLVAGGGIVADSDPHAELAETQAKFQAMLSAIVRP
jgi:isochorismate synthase